MTTDEQDERLSLRELPPELLQKVRDILGAMAAELLPKLEERAPVGRGDGDAVLPNSLRLLTTILDAADVSELLEDEADVSVRTLRDMRRGKPTERKGPAVLAALARMWAKAALADATDVQLEAFEREATPALEEVCRRWDALARVIGCEVRPEHAASIVLAVVAVDLGIRIAASRRALPGVLDPWMLREPEPLRHAIESIVLPGLGLTYGDVYVEKESELARGDRRWTRSTLSDWRLRDVVPEPQRLRDFARDVVLIARAKGTATLRPDSERRVLGTLRAARCAAALSKQLVEAFPPGEGERVLSDFRRALSLVIVGAEKQLAGKGAVVAYAMAHALGPTSKTALVDEQGAPSTALAEQLGAAGLTHDQTITLARLAMLARLQQGDEALEAQLEKLTLRSLTEHGWAAPEAQVLGVLLARELPESGLRRTVEQLGRDASHVVFERVQIVSLVWAFSILSPEHRVTLQRKAGECAAILPVDEVRRERLLS